MNLFRYILPTSDITHDAICRHWSINPIDFTPIAHTTSQLWIAFSSPKRRCSPFSNRAVPFERERREL